MGSSTQTTTFVARRRFVGSCDVRRKNSTPFESFNNKRPVSNPPKTTFRFSHVPRPPKVSGAAVGIKRWFKDQDSGEVDSWFMGQDKRAKMSPSYGFGWKNKEIGRAVSGQERKRPTVTTSCDQYSSRCTTTKLISCDSSAVTKAIQAAKLVSKYSDSITKFHRPHVKATAEIDKANDLLIEEKQRQRQRQSDREADRRKLDDMEKYPDVQFENTFQTMRELELLAGPKCIDFFAVISTFSGTVIKEEDIFNTASYGPRVQTIEADEETSVEETRYHQYYMKEQLPREREAARLALNEIEKSVFVEDNWQTMRELYMLMYGPNIYS